LRLDGLRAADGQALPPYLKAEITRECRRLHQVIEMIAEVEAEQEAALEVEAGRAAQLVRLRGIGLVSATVLVNEVFFRDFRNRREVPARDEPRSNSPGCGCGTNRAAPWRNGSANASVWRKDACDGSCLWRWRAS